jgi:Co/Zn/Cd efflux system component
MRKLIVFLTLVVTFVLFTISTYTLLFSFPLISDTFEQFNNIIGIKLTSDQSDQIEFGNKKEKSFGLENNNLNNFNNFGQKIDQKIYQKI